MLLDFTSIPVGFTYEFGPAPGFLSWDVSIIIHDKLTQVNGLLYCDRIPCLPACLPAWNCQL
jgi:hypothetical protein